MSDSPPKGRLKAAWTLVVVVTFSAELAFSAISMPIMWLSWPFLIMMYGAGVLLIRDAVARVGGGWPSLVLLAVAYELLEDGFGLQALTSPNMYNAAEWGPRVLGFNTTYWESQIGYHLVFSVLIPILLVDMMFPRHKGRPYLKTPGMIGTGIAAVAGLAVAKLTFGATEDPGYQAPLGVLAGLGVVIIALAVVALAVLPRRYVPAVRDSGSVPSRAVMAGFAAAVVMAFLWLLMPPGNPPAGPAVFDVRLTFIPMAIAAAIAVFAGWQVHRWAATPGFDDQSWIALATGALVGHTIFPVSVMPRLPLEGILPIVVVGGSTAAVLAVTLVALGLLSKKVRARAVQV